MPSHYSDIRAIPQPDMRQSDSVAYIMQTLHRFLPACEGRIGIGFPAYGQSRTLGGIIRLFGSENDLRQLLGQLHATALPDYALIDSIQSIPHAKIIAHARFTRRQQKGQSDLRRAEKRLRERGHSEEDIAKRLAGKAAKTGAPNLPHLHLKSASTGQTFVLAIQRTQTGHPQKGRFNSYGLSQQGATVPLF